MNMARITEAFKDAKALVTDVLTAPFENSIELYRLARKDGSVAGSGNGVNPIQAAGWVIGAKVVENTMSIPILASMPERPIVGVAIAALNQIVMGNVTAGIIRDAYRKPHWPRTAARNEARRAHELTA